MNLESKLENSLRNPINTFEQFYDFTLKTHDLINEKSLKLINSSSSTYSEYFFYLWDISPRPIRSRPINSNLYISRKNKFRESFKALLNQTNLFLSSSNLQPLNISPQLLNSVLYTMSISLGIAADIVLESQGAKKNVGERFGDLIASILDKLEITHSTEIQPFGKSRIDLVISPHPSIRSNKKSVDPDEVFCSIKFSSKDRFKHIFSDKKDLESACNAKIKMIALFNHDVQRKGKKGVAKTFVPGIFTTMHDANPLDGVYYFDLPRGYNNQGIKGRLSTFDDFILHKLWNII